LLKDLQNLASDVIGKTGPTQEWYITAERAEGVRDKDRFSKSDPYLKIEFGGKHVRTRTVKNDLSPYWNETFHFQLASGQVNDIRLTVMDDDIGFDDSIGTATVSRADLPMRSGEEKYLQVPIFRKQQASGVVHLRVKLLNDGQTSSSNQPMYQSSNISSYPPQQQMPQSQSGYGYQQQPMSSYNTQFNQPPNYNTSFNSNQQPYSQTQPFNQNQSGQMPPTNQQQQPQPNTNYYSKQY